jgi:type IX secretion system PorP/SprF family membrane protein
MIMRRFILLISVFLGMFVQYSLAQVDSHFSLFEYAQNVSNPGAAGSNEAMCVTSMHRQQWVGFEGHPQTTVFTFDMPIPKMPIGVGLTVNEDGLGYQKDLNIGINGAYRAELDFGMLGVGVGLGIINRSIDADWITWESLNGGTVYEDAAIPHMESKTSFDMSFGATLVNEKFWVGLSATHLLQPTINFDIELPSKVKRHYYLTGGYVYSLPNPSFDLLPAVIVQSDGSTMEAAINAKILYEKKFWGGLSYRYNDAIVPMVGVHLVNGISFAYSYDIVISQMAGNTGGTHELMVRYCFSVDGGKTPGRYRSVRRL